VLPGSSGCCLVVFASVVVAVTTFFLVSLIFTFLAFLVIFLFTSLPTACESGECERSEQSEPATSELVHHMYPVGPELFQRESDVVCRHHEVREERLTPLARTLDTLGDVVGNRLRVVERAPAGRDESLGEPLHPDTSQSTRLLPDRSGESASLVIQPLAW